MILVLSAMVRVSWDPSTYHRYSFESVDDWVHPTSDVALVCGLVVLETMVLLAIFLAPKPARLWSRALIGGLFFLPWAFFSTLFIIHAPIYLILHHLWVWFLAALLILSAIGSRIQHLRESRATSRP